MRYFTLKSLNWASKEQVKLLLVYFQHAQEGVIVWFTFYLSNMSIDVNCCSQYAAPISYNGTKRKIG